MIARILKPVLIAAVLAAAAGPAMATVFLPIEKYQRWWDVGGDLETCAERKLPRLLSRGTPDASIVDRALSACERHQFRFEAAFLEAGERREDLPYYDRLMRQRLAQTVAGLRAVDLDPAELTCKRSPCWPWLPWPELRPATD